jgi:hypothetical protein
MKSDYKAKRHKFMLAYNTLEDLQPRIEELLERIRAVEPGFEVTHHGRKAEVESSGPGDVGGGNSGGDGGGAGVPGLLPLRPGDPVATDYTNIQPAGLG